MCHTFANDSIARQDMEGENVSRHEVNKTRLLVRYRECDISRYRTKARVKSKHVKEHDKVKKRQKDIVEKRI